MVKKYFYFNAIIVNCI